MKLANNKAPSSGKQKGKAKEPNSAQMGKAWS
jgi:hypothetical protein